MLETIPRIPSEQSYTSVTKIQIKENNMNIAKSLTTLSLAIAMVGGLVLLAPSSADAASKAIKKNARICFSGNNFCHDFKKIPVPPRRPCNRKGFACIL